MLERRQMWVGPVLVALLLSGWTRGMRRENGEMRAASALFGEFETVFYSKVGLVSGSGAYKQLSEQDADTLRVPFAELLGGLGSLGKSASEEIVSGGEAVLVGAKDFHAPTGLGSVQSQRCYIIVLGKEGGPDLRRYFSGTPVGSASGNPVWQWSAPPHEGHPKPYMFYIVEVPRSYVLASNSLDELQTITTRLISLENSTPTFADIRDWKLVSQHDYWGYRRYRHTRAVDPEAAGTADITPSAEALTFFVDPKQKTGVLRLLASDDSAAEKLNAAMTTARIEFPPFKPSGSGAWETMIPFAGDQKTGERMFITMGLFGFAVYL